MAGAQLASGDREASREPPADHGPAHHRHAVPVGAGRDVLHPRRVRVREDGDLAGAVEVREHELHRVRGVRRARERDGGGAVRVPRAEDGAEREGDRHHEPHVPGGEHVEHAGGGARGVDLHGHHDRGVLPRHGNERGDDGGLVVALGGGAARDLGPSGRDARGQRVPRVPVGPSGGVLRASGPRAPDRVPRARGLGDGGGRGVPARRRLLRPRDHRDAVDRAGVLGPREEARPAKTLPSHQLARELQQVRSRAGALLRGHGPRVHRHAQPRAPNPAGGGQSAGNRAAGGKGIAVGGPEGDHGGGEDHPRRLPPAERVLRVRFHVPSPQIGGNAPNHHPFLRLLHEGDPRLAGGREGDVGPHQGVDDRSDLPNHVDEVLSSEIGGGGNEGEVRRAVRRHRQAIPNIDGISE